jgi:hypothetical protein
VEARQPVGPHEFAVARNMVISLISGMAPDESGRQLQA